MKNVEKSYSTEDILNLFKKFDKKLDKLKCFIEECCSKIPINVGDGVGLFKRFLRNKWEFKSIVPGTNITITEEEDTITINSTGGGDSFSCEDLNSCSTTNLPEGTNLYFTNPRAVSALTGQNISIFNNNVGYITEVTESPNRVAYFDNNGDLKTNSNFVYNETSNIFNAALPIPGGFYQLSSGASKIGTGDINSPDAYFQVTPSALSWGIPLLSADVFLLPYNDGNSGDVLTTDGSGNLTFQTPSSGSGTVTSVAALTLGTTGTDLSSTVANSTTTPVITLNVPTASATNRGALSSTDWSTFNNKQNSLGFTPENVVNKSDSFTASSSTTYASTKAVVDGLATKFITIPFISNAFNPLDATNYFLGGITNLLAPSTTNTDQDFTIGFAGTVIGCVIQVHGNSVVGSSEDVTLSLRNNTANTTTTIGVFKTNSTATTTVSTAITGTSIAVGATDSICLQINGTWATNPQAVRLTGYLMVRI